MNREQRAELARQTIEILQTGGYVMPDGTAVPLAALQRASEMATRLFQPGELDEVREQQRNRLADLRNDHVAEIEVHNETTLQGIARLQLAGADVIAALNFGSANNPGGGFLSGSQAQEESLARSSGLHGSLLKAWSYYEHHRAQGSPIYSDALILSPGCPVFRDDAGAFLPRPLPVHFISGAAPNAGAIAKSRPNELPTIPAILERRVANVLALAACQGYRHLVLGAWGCGVFRNDPVMVAQTFVRLLLDEGWARHFDCIVFSVLDTSPNREVFCAFGEALRSRGAV
ncbi:TIGR02452 family protein [Ideonella sp. DXS29W]|uniref:TIGR02452 family protein n=1 Tax=Ideonella lacteola TaxID=2984193 RepID=A0ABU9BTL2_9BURK